MRQTPPSLRPLAGLSALLLLAGCPGPRHARPDQVVDDPAVAIAAIDARGEAIKTLSGVLSMEMWKRDERVKVRQLILLQRPDKVRVDTLSPFDQPLSMMASDGERITLYSLEDQRYQQGPASARNLGRLVPLRVEGEEIVALLRGGAALIRHDESTIAWDGELGTWRLSLRGGVRRQEVHLEPAALRVVQVRRWQDEALVYEARFGSYTDTSPTAVPQRLRFEVPDEELRIDIAVVEVQTNVALPEDAFRIEQPRGIPVQPL